MSHTECIGPPGVGNSALYQGLVADTDYVGWDPISAVQLATSDQLSTITNRRPDTVVKPLYKKVRYYWVIKYLYKEFIWTPSPCQATI